MVSQKPQEQIAVKCAGCGQVYHLSPLTQGQRAKCRGCGHEFEIAGTPVSRYRRAKRQPLERRAEKERLIGAALARNVASFRRPDVGWRAFLDALVRRPLSAASVALVVTGLTAAALAIPSVLAQKTARAEVPRPVVSRPAKLAPARADLPFPTVSDLIQKVEPAVVQIETRTAVGSGFVLDPAGLIVTCYHCIEDQVSARVVFADNHVLEVEGVRAMSQGSDLVILQVKPSEPLPCLSLAQTPPPKGEPVVTIGSPAGLAFTFSEGSISALRSVAEIERIAWRLRGGGRLKLRPSCGLVQFTATTMPGHSGGPVVDWHGNVLGVTSFGLPYQGRSFEFAISATEIRSLAAHLDATATPLNKMWPEDVSDFPEFEPAASP
jgi:putative serine protease PepD